MREQAVKDCARLHSFSQDGRPLRYIVKAFVRPIQRTIYHAGVLTSDDFTTR
jgi:hypothetical protein